MSNFNLVGYSLIWFLTLWMYQKRKKHVDAGSVILLSQLFYSIASLLFYFLFYGFQNIEIKLFPFVYLYLTLLLVMLPILSYNDLRISKIISPNILFLNFLSIIYIFASILFLAPRFPETYSGIKKIIINPAAGTEIYRLTLERSYNLHDGEISSIFAIFSNMMSAIAIFLLFYYLTLRNRGRLIIIGLAVSIIGRISLSIALSQRGPAVEEILTVVAAYFFFRRRIPEKLNSQIKKIGIISFVLISIPIFAITVSRFGEREGGAVKSVFSYAGQANINFNQFALDNGGLRYGDRTFPLFKKMLGFKDVPSNYRERREKYPNLKINDEVFIGFVGDFTLDFGPYVTPLIFAFISLFIMINAKIRNNAIWLDQSALIFLAICINIQGGMKLYSFSDIGGNLELITYLLFYVGLLVFRLHTTKTFNDFEVAVG